MGWTVVCSQADVANFEAADGVGSQQSDLLPD